MSEKAKATVKINRLGLQRDEYVGSKSTLCVGCGHDSVTNHLISALYQSSIDPYSIAKMSGIGCSSKTPAYFLSKSHGFNSIHGRMAPMATGARIANRSLKIIGISGDGDTASIGLGSFVHLLRRNTPMLYIVENNGVYGLTKGQFSATADRETYHKSGDKNPHGPIDICSLALDVGCDFVARSFSGDAKQLTALISAGLRHPGTALIDVVSPCVTFANHDGSTKSFASVKAKNIQLQEMGFIQPQDEISVDYPEGERVEVKLHDGSVLWLSKVDSRAHNPHDRLSAINLIKDSNLRGEILTGLFFIDSKTAPLEETLGLGSTPLVQLGEEHRPKAAHLEDALKAFI